MGDEFQPSLPELADPAGEEEEEEERILWQRFLMKLFTISAVETHPKRVSEGRSGLGASVTEVPAGGAAASPSSYQSHADSLILVSTRNNRGLNSSSDLPVCFPSG